MNMGKHLLFVAIAFALPGLAMAQFTLSGEIRPRTEFSHGYSTLAKPDQMPSTFTSQRTRLNLNYDEGIIKTRLVLQDVRMWGGQAQLVGNEDFGVSIHEAWAEGKLSKKLSLKVGRQELGYDNQRMLGAVGWAHQGRSHDLALFKYQGKFSAHLGIAYHENNVRTNNFYLGPDAYKAMQFLWLNQKRGNFNLSLLVLNNGNRFTEKTDTLGQITEQSIVYSHTAGYYIEYKRNKLALASSFYYQAGRDAAKKDLKAYEVSLDANYKLSSKFMAFAGLEVLSGTAYNEDPKINRSFSPFYTTGHKFSGYMDYFYAGNHFNNVGLRDIFIGGSYTSGQNNLTIKVHHFAAMAEIAAGADMNLGTELDLVYKRSINQEFEIEAGYGQMFATPSMELLKGGSRLETQQWAYVMLTFKPAFFTTR
jgi:hypothetical protein